MFSTRYSAAAAALFSSIASSEAVFDAAGAKNLAVYYGQGNGVNTQLGLRHYCDQPDIDVIPIGFLDLFPQQGNGFSRENFANQCWAGSVYYGPGSDHSKDGLLTQCPDLQEDIVYCQKNTNTKILLSLGGSTAGYQLTGAQAGIDFADFIWGAYGPLTDAWKAAGGIRPLDRGKSNSTAADVIDIDGFDFDIEHASTDLSAGYIAMITRLRTHFSTVSTKKYLITGAPQCPLPEYNMGDMISGAEFDIIWVQFYNNGGNGCTARNFADANALGKAGNSKFNYDDWTIFLSGGLSKNAKIYIGLLGSHGGSPVTTDYITAAEAKGLIAAYQSKENFGGVMLWEATGAENNLQTADVPATKYCGNYYNAIRAILDGKSSNACPSSSTSSSASSTVTSSTVSSSTVAPTSTSVTTTSSSSVYTTSTSATSTSASPTPTTVPSVGKCLYIGCYSEEAGGRTLDGGKTTDYVSMTVETCATFCKGWALFGVQYGGECYCDNNLNHGPVLKAPEECNQVCAGSPTEFCGAANRLDVYQCKPISSTSSSAAATSTSSVESSSTTEPASTTSSESSSYPSSTKSSAAPSSTTDIASSTISNYSSSTTAPTSSSTSSATESSSTESSSESSSHPSSTSSASGEVTSTTPYPTSTPESSSSTTCTSSTSTDSGIVTSSTPYSTHPSAPYTNSSTTSCTKSKSTSTTSYTLSTVYATSTYSSNGGVTTETIALYTTYCPYEATKTKTSAAPVVTPYTTSTVYTTYIYTVTSCAETVTDCPARIGKVTTEVVSLYTTVCPVTEAGYTAKPITTPAYPIYPVSSVKGSTSTKSSTFTTYVTINVVHSTATVVPVAPYPTGPVGGGTAVGTGLPSVSLVYGAQSSSTAKGAATPVPSKYVAAGGAESLKLGMGMVITVLGCILLGL